MHRLGVRLVATEEKATNRPSDEMEGWTLSLLPWFSLLFIEAQDVLPLVRSRTKICAKALSHGDVRLVASDSNATKRPSPEIFREIAVAVARVLIRVHGNAPCLAGR